MLFHSRGLSRNSKCCSTLLSEGSTVVIRVLASCCLGVKRKNGEREALHTHHQVFSIHFKTSRVTEAMNTGALLREHVNVFGSSMALRGLTYYSVSQFSGHYYADCCLRAAVLEMCQGLSGKQNVLKDISFHFCSQVYDVQNIMHWNN